jgi:hypothetical protein
VLLEFIHLTLTSFLEYCFLIYTWLELLWVAHDGNFVKTRMSELKGQGDEAFKKQDYLKASVFYTQVFPRTFFFPV